MAASLGEGDDFDTWISDKFKALNTDEAVFAPYVKSIVEGDESLEEKIDALDGILAELADGNFDVEAFRQEILSRWDLEQMRKKSGAAVNGSVCLNGGTDLESKLQSILKMNDELTGAKSTAADQAIDNKGTKNLAQAPDSELRAAILSQYKDDSDSDSDDQGNGAGPKRSVPSGSGGGGGAGLERNTNSERVLNEMKDRRDREKADAATKRQKDKEDRAKQKQQAQDRKDKAKKKATKVERKTR